MSEPPVRSDPSRGNPEQVLRLFFSADLATGSSFKYKHPPLSDEARHHLRELGYRKTTPWTEVFGEFFEYFASQFRNNIQSISDTFGVAQYPVRIWKIQGDEILLYTELVSAEQVYWQIRAFELTIRDADARLSQDFGLGVKGACWTAGFPIRNTRIVIQTSENPHVVLVKDEGDFVLAKREVPAVTANPQLNALMAPYHTLADFIGVEMDHGFRICSHTHAGRVVASVDACYFAALGKGEAQTTLMRQGPTNTGPIERSPPLRLAHVAWKILKGVLGDVPVPIFWVEFGAMNAKRRTRYAFDAEENELVRLYLDETRSAMLGSDEYLQFFADYHRGLVGRGVDHIVPYISPLEMPSEQHVHFRAPETEEQI